MGEVITFYSYKGGTGRTMAMANVAWILAAAGHRVLMVDWDLEAPGLHRYFYPFLRDKDLVSSTGIIDIVMDFAVQATTPASTAKEREPTWYLPYADVLRHAVSVDWSFGDGRLDLLPAGQQNDGYATKVNSFNWDNFYERLGGGTFLDALRASMLREYEYVLIDSRTGVSDTSGICTVQLPDKVVVCFTLNRQSIEGAASVARSIVEARSRARRSPLSVFPVPTRVEKAETLRLEAARTAARTRFDDLLGHVPVTARPAYWDETEIAYQPYYAYEEVLATFTDGSPKVGTLLHTMESLAARLIGQPAIDWRRPAPEARAGVLAQYGWTRPAPPEAPKAAVLDEAPKVPEAPQAPQTPEASPVLVPDVRQSPPVAKEPAGGYWFYFAYAAGDVDAHLQRFVEDLGTQVRQRLGLRIPGGFRRDVLEIGEDWSEAMAMALATSRTAVCVVSPRYVASEFCGREFSAIQQRGVPILPITWAPVSGGLPEALARIETGNPPGPSRLTTSGLRALLQVRRFEHLYDEAVASLAKRICDLGRNVTAPTEVPPSTDLPNAFADRAQPSVGRRVAVVCLAPASAAGNEWDWRPFGSASIREMIARAVAGETLEIDAVPAAKFSAGARAGGMTLILVDPRTATSSQKRLLGEVHDSVTRIMLVGKDLRLQDVSEFVAQVRNVWDPLAMITSETSLVSAVRRELLVMRSEVTRQAANERPLDQTAPLPKLTP